MTDPVIMERSETKPVAIHQYVNHKSQIQYVDVIAGEDEICIAWISGYLLNLEVWQKADSLNSCWNGHKKRGALDLDR